MESLWKKQQEQLKPKSKTIDSNVKNMHWDVIVIGAGMAGVLTAYFLTKQGKKVLILEAEEIASGQTEKTTAKITSQHGVKYSKLIKNVGVEKAQLYAQANEQAINEYDRLIQKEGIDCDFEWTEAFLYTMQDEKLLKEEAKAASKLGIDTFFTKETELPFPVTGAVGFYHQAQFSPLKFIGSIASQLTILEHTQVIAINGKRVIARDTVFFADDIIVATHYPIVNVPGFYFLRQHQERSYVLALSGCGKIEGMYYGVDRDGLSFRQAGENLLISGSTSRTGKNKCGGAYNFLLQASKRYFPQCKEVARWSAQDCMPHDEIPFIGKYSILTPHLYVATGFQKWGMTSSMIAAIILRDKLCGIENPYEKLFSPQRMHLRAGIRNFLIDIGISVKGMSRGLLHKKSARCSHMGCKLSWNPDEKSWDCPCHGSRFDENGNLLDNPAREKIL